MQYKIIRTEHREEPIEHALFGKGGAQKGSTWANHKYIARQKTANSWRYFYNQAELAAAKAGKQVKKTADQAKALPTKVKKAVSDVKKYTIDTTNKANRYKEAIRKEDAQAKKAESRERQRSANVAREESEKDWYNKRARDLEMLRKASRNPLAKALYNVSEKNAAREYKKHDDKAWEEEDKRLDSSLAKYAHEDNAEKLRASKKEFNESIDKSKWLLGAALNTADKAISKGKDKVSSLLSNAKSVTSDTVNKGKKAIDDLLNYSKNVDKRAEAYDVASTKAGNQKRYEDAEKLQKKANEAEDEKSSLKYKTSKAIDDVSKSASKAASDVSEKIAVTAKDISNKAQEKAWDAKRNVEEFADKAKNFATNKAYRNDKTYRDMVDGVSSMKQDLKSVNAYIDELRENGDNSPEAKKELRDNIKLRREIEDSLDFVQDEIEKYENRNK